MSGFICNGVDGKFIQSTRIGSIINTSRQREDGLFHKIEEGTTHVTCHSNCLRTYCSKHHIKRLFAKRMQTQCENSQTSKRLRSHSNQHSFNFKSYQIWFIIADNMTIITRRYVNIIEKQKETGEAKLIQSCALVHCLKTNISKLKEEA